MILVIIKLKLFLLKAKNNVKISLKDDKK